MYGKLFGQFLYDRGVISASQFKNALILQENADQHFGIVALEQNMLTREQIRVILEKQQRSTKRFGAIAVDLGYLNQKQVIQLVHLQQSAHIRLGDILVTEGYIDLTDIADYLSLFHQENRQIEADVRRQLATTGYGHLFESIIRTTQSYFSRAICGKAKAMGSETHHNEFDAEAYMNAILSCSIERPKAELVFGLFLNKRTAFSLYYCLTGKTVRSRERIRNQFEEYFQSLGYLVNTELRRAGHAPANDRLDLPRTPPDLDGTHLFLPFTSTIGPFLFFVNIRKIT